MKNLTGILIIPGLLLAFWGCERKLQVPAEISRFVEKADFVFHGSIVVLRTSTIDADEPANLSVVKVTKVIEGSDDLRAFEGEQITVRLRDISSATVGETRVFFTRVRTLGESLGVDEVGSFSETKFDDLDGKISIAIQQNKDAILEGRLNRAELVVTGRVVVVRRSEHQYPKVTEHNPLWMEAEIEISRTFKGGEMKTVTVLFPGSDDESYMDSPKLKAGDSGIFLLRKGNIRMGDENALSLVFRKDRLNVEQADKVKSLLNNK